MRISARNRLKGKVVEVTKGATTAHVRIDAGGTVVTAAITSERWRSCGFRRATPPTRRSRLRT